MATIRLSKKDQTIKVVYRKDNIRLKKTEENIKLQHVGKTGPKGDPGEGVPTGGLAGELLVKSSGDDYDTEWATITGSDKYYVQSFLTSNTIDVSHNLAKYPAVTVHDSSGDEVEGEIEHLNINSLTIKFSAPFSGTVTCN